ncbi:hypothetical protein EZV62_000956 [Acer yangbiense]|uniref:Chromo domain-containing protein n=1 Tax=Acer yangbiense TaxID=1000413 RepID=A0A5C7ISQ7_9ROSI|nr:hypothetical protein EZV62_000956 [Acer yangbiense]
MIILTLGDRDTVLGMLWIQEVEPILLDAKRLSMSFKRENRWITLQGIKETWKLSQLDRKRVASQLSKAQRRIEPIIHLYSLEVEKEISEIHLMFYVSQLKKSVETTVCPSSSLPPTGPDKQMLVYPVAIVDRKVVKRHNQAVAQILVQWSNTTLEDATWVDASCIRS